jgi:hypothetical protein
MRAYKQLGSGPEKKGNKTKSRGFGASGVLYLAMWRGVRVYNVNTKKE